MLMNIAQALKVKNRLAGQIADLQNKVTGSNRFTNEAPKQHDVPALAKKLDESRAELIQLKAKIQLANKGITFELVEIAEVKAHLAHLTKLRGTAYAGEIKSLDAYTKAEKVTDSQVRLAEVEAQMETAQNRINDLQDRIDAYNATTQI